MIKSVKINDKIYNTIIIPKGTILFRGVNIVDEKKYYNIFNDLIGYRNDKYFSISPIMNVFFYPVPYVSDAVNIYNTHIMYITQYDIEILLMIKPSNITRANKSNKYSNVITTCNNISQKDKCGFEMSAIDPCFTDLIIDKYPHIDGYITIAEQDANTFKKKYKNIIEKYKNIEKASHIIPGIIADNRDIQGIPEIVLFPLRFRYNECFMIKEKFKGPSSFVRYCINNRAQYNYFPLLYFTSDNIYTFNDLSSINNIQSIIKSNRVYNGANILNNTHNYLSEKNTQIPKIHNNINIIFNKMLTDGYIINGIKYTIKVNKTLGFYKLFIEYNNIRNNFTKKQKNIIHTFKDDGFMEYLKSSITFPNNKTLNNIYMNHKEYLDTYLTNLYNNGYSTKKRFKLNRGNPNSLILDYYIDKVIDIPQLKKYTNIRKQKYNKTYKNIMNRDKILQSIYDINLSNIDSVNSDFNSE